MRLRQNLKITRPRKMAWQFLKAPLGQWLNVRAWALLAVVLPGQFLRAQYGSRRPLYLTFQGNGGNRELFHCSKIAGKNTVAFVIGNCRVYCGDNAEGYARLVTGTFNINCANLFCNTHHLYIVLQSVCL